MHVADLYDDYECFGAARLPGVKWLYRKALSRADGIVCVSNSLKGHVMSTARPSNEPQVILNAVDKALFRPLAKSECRERLDLPRPAHRGDTDHDLLIRLMEGVEDIPGTTLAEGLPWSWESFPEYLDAVDRQTHTVDLGAQVPHATLRAYVMGERGADHTADPTADEIAEMGRITADALRAGAMGFATSRSVNHKSVDGSNIGSMTAHDEELFGIADAVARPGSGCCSSCPTSRTSTPSGRSCARSARRRAAAVGVAAQFDPKPDNWRKVLDWIERAAGEGADMKAET